MTLTRIGRRRPVPGPAAAAVLVAVVALSAPTLGSGGSSQASALPAVSGEAYGHYTKVGLFGGPPAQVGPQPRVVLPPGGVDTPLTETDADGGAAVFGPAHIFSGKSPVELGTAPPSGPITVSTSGSPGGSVTSSVSIGLHPKPVPATCDGQPSGTKNCSSPGGFGPVVPNEGDELHATCTADDKGVSGSTRFVNAILSRSTDEGGEPKDREPIPDSPPPNYTREGVITNVGDRFRVVYNEQIIDPVDGSITVNAIHMFLLGDIAVGEQILGHVRCARSPAGTSPTTAIGSPSTSTPGPGPSTPVSDTKPDEPATPAKASTLPLVVVVAFALVAGLAILFLWTRRRRRPSAAEQAPEAPS